MFYITPFVVENEKLTVCPNCQNEEFESSGSYCKICGKPRSNYCTNDDRSCGRVNAANARYCEYCGEKTVFFDMGLLKAWEEVVDDERVEQLPSIQEIASSGFTSVETDELPF